MYNQTDLVGMRTFYYPDRIYSFFRCGIFLLSIGPNCTCFIDTADSRAVNIDPLRHLSLCDGNGSRNAGMFFFLGGNAVTNPEVRLELQAKSLVHLPTV